MSNPYHKSATAIDPPAPNKVPPTDPPSMWRSATLLLLIAAPAMFGQHFLFPMHFGIGLLRSFIFAIASAEIMLILALAAWSPISIGRRILYASGLLSVMIVASVLGEFLNFPVHAPTIAAMRAAMIAAGYLAAVVPLVMLRCFTGWRLTPPAAERRLSILDLFGLIALVAVALTVGGIAQSLWDFGRLAPNGPVADARIFALTNAISLATLAIGVAWMCFRTHPLAAVPLILAPVVLSTIVPCLPYLLSDKELPPNRLSGLLWAIGPTKCVSAYLLAGIFWNLQGRGVNLMFGRQDPPGE